MKSRLRVRPHSKVKRGGPKTPKPLTLEEIRERYDFGTRERVVAECEELERMREASREATNAQNRAKTQTGKAFRALIADEIIEPGDELHIGESAFSFDFAYSDDIDVEALYKLVQAGKVKLDDFLRSISVSKDAASKFIGEHVLMKVTNSDQPGKSMDVRVRKLDKPAHGEPRWVKKPPKKSKKLDRATEHAPPAAVATGRPVRRFARARRR